MAGETLQESLSGLRFAGADNSWGLGASALASSLPTLINPRSSVGRNLAIGLGGTLLTALLGYQARQQASEDTIATMDYGNQILKMTNPDDRLALAKSVGEQDSQRGAKLATLVNALGAQETITGLNNQVKQADMIRDVEQARLIAEANLNLQLGEKGTELFNRQNKALEEQIELRRKTTTALAPSAWITKNISKTQQDALASANGITTELLRLSNDFRKLDQNALTFQVKSAIPGSDANLLYARMLAIIPRTARLMGETGPLGEQEQARILKATLGSTLSGTSSIADRLLEITTAANNMAQNRAASLEAMHMPEGGTSLLGTLGFKPVDNSGENDEEAERQALIAELTAGGHGN